MAGMAEFSGHQLNTVPLGRSHPCWVGVGAYPPAYKKGGPQTWIRYQFFRFVSFLGFGEKREGCPRGIICVGSYVERSDACWLISSIFLYLGAFQQSNTSCCKNILAEYHRGFAAQFPYVDVLTVEGRSTFCGASNFGVSQKFGPALSG